MPTLARTSRRTARDVMLRHVSSAFASGCVVAHHLLCFTHFWTVCLQQSCALVFGRGVLQPLRYDCALPSPAHLPLWGGSATEPRLLHCRSFQVRAIARSGTYHVCFLFCAIIPPLYVHTGFAFMMWYCIPGWEIRCGWLRWGPACALSPPCV